MAGIPNNFPLFKGMLVLHPEKYDISRITSISEMGTVTINSGALLYGRSLICPITITSVKIGFFGFGVFKDDEQQILYHEPNPEDPDHNFYGEYNLKEGYLLLSAKGKTIELDEIKYIHQIQLALIGLGFYDLAMKTIVESAGKTNII